MGRSREEIFVADFETTSEDCEWFKNQIPIMNEDNELCKIPRVLCWAIKKLKGKEYNKEEQPIYFYNFITNNKANKNIQWKDIRGKRQEEAYNFDGVVVGNNEKSFIDFILNIQRNTIIYFHNLAFDGTYIIQMLKELKEYGFDQVHCEQVESEDGNWYLKEVGYEKNENGKVVMSPLYWRDFRRGKKIYSIELVIKNRDRDYITITFKCSLNLLSCKVQDLGTSLGDDGYLFNNKLLTKYINEEQEQNIDFYKVEPLFDKSVEEFYKLNKEFVDYCIRDVEIVRISMLNFSDTFNQYETIKKHNQVYQQENERRKNNLSKTNWGKYFTDENGNVSYNVFQKTTIASLMRTLIEDIYCKAFQQNNHEFDYYTPYRHTINEDDISKIKKMIGKSKKKQEEFDLQLKMYKSLVFMDKQDHDLIQHPLDFFNNGRVVNLYGGGIVQFNERYQKEQDNIRDFNDGSKLDVSSAYPFQMTKPLPFGPLIPQHLFEQEPIKLIINGKQVYINCEDGFTFKPTYYSKSEKRVKKSCEVIYGGYNDLLDNKDKFARILYLAIDWIEPKNIEQDPTQFATTVPFFKSVAKVFDKEDKLTSNSTQRYAKYREENITCMIWEDEWEFIKKYYNFKLHHHEVNCDNVEIDNNEIWEDSIIGIQIYYTLKAPFMKDMMEELYERKDYYSKILQDACRKLTTKIALNSSYGSLGIKSNFPTTTYISKDTLNIIKNNLDDFKTNKKISFDGLRFKDLKETTLNSINESLDTNYCAISLNIENDKKPCYNMLAASYITCLERIYLLSFIEAIGPQYFAYSDTDSVIFGNINNDVRKEINLYISNKPHDTLNIGSWEYEITKLEGFNTSKAKNYVQIFYNYDFTLDENGNEKGYYNIKKVDGFYDENGNWNRPTKIKEYCKKEDAILNTYFVNSGYNLKHNSRHKKLIEDVMILTIKERQKMSDEDFDKMFSVYNDNDWKEIFNKFKDKKAYYDFWRMGNTFILDASLEPIKKRGNVKYVGGTVLGLKHKSTSFGKQ